MSERSELTEAEREAICQCAGDQWPPDQCDAALEAVEQIIAERLAAQRAEIAANVREWDRSPQWAADLIKRGATTQALMSAMGCNVEQDVGDCPDCGTVPHADHSSWFCNEHDWFESDITTEGVCGYAVMLAAALPDPDERLREVAQRWQWGAWADVFHGYKVPEIIGLAQRVTDWLNAQVRDGLGGAR